MSAEHAEATEGTSTASALEHASGTDSTAMAAESKRDRRAYPTSAVGGKRASLVGAVWKAVLSITQVVVALLSGSAALLADAIHNVTDVIHSLATYVALRFAEKPADEDHPYGHGNAETLGALVVCGIMFSAGVLIVAEALRKALSGEPLAAPALWGVAGALLSIVVNEGLHRYYKRRADRVKSPALLAAAADSRQDSGASVVAVAGIVAAHYALPWLDIAAAVVIGVYIMVVAVRQAWGNLHLLMVGVPPDDELVRRVHEALAADPRVRDAHNVKVMQVGAWLHVALDMAVDGRLTVLQGHDIAESVIDTIRALDARIGDVQVHTDPWIDGAVHDTEADRQFHTPSARDVRFRDTGPIPPAERTP